MEGGGRARTAKRHGGTDDIPVVAVGDLNVRVSLINATCQLSTVVEQLGLG